MCLLCYIMLVISICLRLLSQRAVQSCPPRLSPMKSSEVAQLLMSLRFRGL